MKRLRTPLAIMISLVPVLAAAPVDYRTEEDRLFYAVFVARLQELRAGDPHGGEARIICLAVDAGGEPQSPSRRLMARLRSDPDVRPAADCELRGSRAVEATSGARAVLLTAGPIEWISSDEAWVTLSSFRDQRRSMTRPYRVVRERNRWIALGPILKISPV